MKKLVLLTLMVFSLIACESQEKREISFSALPQKSQQFINQHFADKTIQIVFMEREMFGKEYEVMFVDGTQIDFNNSGSWTEVECKLAPGVPLTFIKEGIVTYVSTRFPNAYIESISYEHNRYEVDLSNHVDLVFDSNGNFLRYDD
ncbi:MAG: PepSY-like domain-containing protein [Bacteroidota bacterium]|nr:PepSY-like domain-containing protein [Bacteroidota bacterium]